MVTAVQGKIALLDPKAAKYWYPLRRHAKQSAFATSIARGCRLVCATAGRGSGKTEIAQRLLVLAMMGKQKHLENNYFYGAPTRAQAKKIGFVPILRRIPKSMILDVNKTDMIITLKNGAVLYVAGLDEPQRLEGKQYVGGVLDECSDMKPKIYDLNILPALSRYKGWCIRIGVPKRAGIGAADFKKCFYEQADESYSWPSEDILDTEEIARAKSLLDEIDYNEQYMASWEDCSGGIFHSFGSHNIQRVSYDPSLRVYVSSDYNVNPMCWVICHQIDNELYQFDELFKRNTNTQASLDEVAARYASHDNGFTFTGDASAGARSTKATSSDIAQIDADPRFKGKIIKYTRSNPRIADRFASCNALFRSADGKVRYHVDASCQHTITDLEQRAYKEGTNIANDKGDIGHITDALGYIIHLGWPLRRQSHVENKVGMV
jgi:hypothetical protein